MRALTLQPPLPYAGEEEIGEVSHSSPTHGRGVARSAGVRALSGVTYLRLSGNGSGGRRVGSAAALEGLRDRLADRRDALQQRREVGGDRLQCVVVEVGEEGDALEARHLDPDAQHPTPVQVVHLLLVEALVEPARL